MLRNAGETLPARGGSARFDPKQSFVHMSIELATALGWNGPQKMPVRSFLHPDDCDGIVETINAIASGDLPGAVSRSRVSDSVGVVQFLDWSFFRSPDPRFVHSVGMLVPSSKRGIASRLLKDVVEVMHDGFAIYDPDDRLILSNEAFRSVLPGYGPTKLSGLRFSEIAELCHRHGVYGEAGGDSKDYLASRIAAHQSGQSVTFQKLASGRVERIEERRLPSGHIVAVHADVTDLHKENIASKQKASATLEFISVISHELRTPLVGLLGMLDELGAASTAEDQDRILKIMRQSGEHLLSIANTTLDLAKIEAGRMEVDQEPFDPADSLVATIERYALISQKKNIEFVADIESIGLRIGDPLKFVQVVENLLSNAVKFTNEGQVRLTLAQDAEEVIKIEVQDTGIGVPPEFLSKMMQPFMQADLSLTRRYGGTGLGLSVVCNLVQLMGGTITCTSALDCGTTFTLRLPLRSATLPAVTKPDDIDVKAPNFAGKHVLIADDNEINRIVLDSFLQKMKFTTDLAVDGEEALSKALTHIYDLVVLDISMPKIDGIDVLRQLRQRSHYSETPIIAVTANVLPNELEAYKAAGFDVCLTKPFRRKDLGEVLTQLLPQSA